MAMFDTVSDSSWVVLGKLTLSGTTPAATAWVDMQGYNAVDLAFLNATVTDAGAAEGYTITMQDSDTTAAADAVAVTAANAVDGVVSTTTTDDTHDDRITAVMGYVGGKRYVRANGVGTSGTNAVIYVLGRRSRSTDARPVVTIGTSTAAT
jgi:hypothetical protein